ncbi:MAG: helix-turn-helix transcriptional regulator [Clostridia bacterium]|nr:helix-turn-helix transcriptional regulator [Clostridia bacterium]
MKFSVAQNIRTIRQLNKLSQKEFGEKLGFSARTISDWECSNTEPDITTLKSIKQIFNVSYEDILD